ncbi:MAG: hypothetical protein KBG82_03985 [Spirochaetes bacterium]|nr:hypothetical protein [Spirochaetota bacterium]MBP8991115.1 hypothetical protein [Spirochaetota bacterium]HOV45674.1 hypothetical protein [Exilispira sp.]HQM89788.1 hypothetical protein [Exilispira sp.]HQQ19608.1 hypothetical protein [Exilispira sp.]
MKKNILFILILLLIFTISGFAQTTTYKQNDVVENFIFRLKVCQLSSYGAKIVYYSYTGYPKILYVPIKFINEQVFIKVDQNVPYSFLHVTLINKKVFRIIVYLPNIMVPEYTTADLSEADRQNIQKTNEINIVF